MVNLDIHTSPSLVEQLSPSFSLAVVGILDLDPRRLTFDRSIGADRRFADDALQVHVTNLAIELCTVLFNVVDVEDAFRWFPKAPFQNAFPFLSLVR